MYYLLLQKDLNMKISITHTCCISFVSGDQSLFWCYDVVISNDENLKCLSMEPLPLILIFLLFEFQSIELFILHVQNFDHFYALTRWNNWYKIAALSLIRHHSAKYSSMLQ